MNQKDTLLRVFSLKIRSLLMRANLDFQDLQEVRLRINAPLIIIYENQEYFVSEQSQRVSQCREAHIVTRDEMKETLEYISNYSLYAFEDEIRQGFITIQGGHRVGLAGKIILENEKIKSIKNITFINVRLSHEVKGCANKVIPYIYNPKNQDIYHTLIISPPRCGKTTILRDLIRQISNGTSSHPGMTVGVVDERSEIGACYMGIPQNDLGMRTDILDCCPKAIGMMMLIRSMSPRVIAIDEIGSREDMEAIEYVINCGCRLIATVHGSSIEDVKSKPALRQLMVDGIFQRLILLSNYNKVGTVERIYDGRGGYIC